MKDPYIGGNATLKAAYAKLITADGPIAMSTLAREIGAEYSNLRSSIIADKVGAIEIIMVNGAWHASIVKDESDSELVKMAMIESMIEPETIAEIAISAGVTEKVAAAFVREQSKLGNIHHTPASRQSDYKYKWVGSLPKINEPKVAEQEPATLEAALESFAEDMEAYARAEAEAEAEPDFTLGSEMQPVVLVLVNGGLNWFSDEAKAIEFAHENARDSDEVMVIYTSKAFKMATQTVVVTVDLIESARKCA